MVRGGEPLNFGPGNRATIPRKDRMRKHGKTDANQTKIVEELRARGYSVLILSSVGGGCPDLAVGTSGRNYFFEIKDPGQPPSKRQLTGEERKFSENWRGHYAVATTALDIILEATGL